MALEQNKRTRRIPLSPEEVATVIAFKKRKEAFQLHQFKKSRFYKWLNIFNCICFFVFCEIIFCYNGPSNHQTHYSYHVIASFGQEYKPDGTTILGEVEAYCVHGKIYKFLVNDYIPVPSKWMTFDVGSDWLLRKELKGAFNDSEKYYRIFAASPILFLSIFTSSILIIGVFFNLNESEHSLLGLTIVSGMTLLCIVFM